MAKKKASADKKTLLTRRQGQQFKEWRRVAVATAANLAHLPGAAVQHGELVAIIAEVDKILAEQAVFQASKQMSSRRLQTLVNQGGKLSTVLKAIAKQRYGHGNDKLVEFGIQPLRSRPKPTVVPPTAPPLEAGTPVPTSTIPPSSK